MLNTARPSGLTYWWYPEQSSGPLAFPLRIYLTIVFFYLLSGCAAGAVAGEIRKHVGAAIHEARELERIQRDLALARSIQQGLLPKQPPDLEGFEIAGWNKPADETGGD